MKPDDEGRLSVKLMVPNTRLFFFFTVNNCYAISKEYMSIWLDQPENAQFKIIEKKYQFMLQTLNVFETNLKSDDVLNCKTYEPNITCLPRSRRPEFYVNVVKTVVAKPKWSYNISLFKDFKPESET